MRQRRLRNFTGEARDVPDQPKIVLSHNHNDSDARSQNNLWISNGGKLQWKMFNIAAMGSLFGQFAAFDPVHSWKYLIEAQKWEHFAEAEIASHFKECNIIQGSRTQPTA